MAKSDTPDPAGEPIQGEPVTPMLRNVVPLPEVLQGRIDLTAWAEALVNKVDYNEPDPDYLARSLLIQTLTADTIDAAFSQGNLRKLQEAIPNVPGASTGPVELYDLYVTGSDFGEGAKCYMILSLRDLETGFETRYTTGATQLQAQILRIVGFGQWPIRCKITRTDRKDKGGRFLFWLFPPD